MTPSKRHPSSPPVTGRFQSPELAELLMQLVTNPDLSIDEGRRITLTPLPGEER